MADTYLVNGTDLHGLAWRIETAEGLYDAPDLRGDDQVVPGVHGSLDPHGDIGFARRRYGPGRIRFHMWVLGVDPGTGLGPSDLDDPAVFLTRIDELQRLFNARVLTIVHERTDGDRQATARLAAPIQVVREPSSPLFGRFVADCVIPAAFWADTTTTTVTDTTLTTGDTLDVSSLAGTGPITDAVLTMGPSSNPRLVCADAYFQYNGVISSGRELVAACGVWTLDDGSGTAWTPALAGVSYGPGPSWFEMDLTATPRQIAVTHTGGGTMSLSVTARRKWLTS